jgi:hypothetical protein
MEIIIIIIIIIQLREMKTKNVRFELQRKNVDERKNQRGVLRIKKKNQGMEGTKILIQLNPSRNLGLGRKNGKEKTEGFLRFPIIKSKSLCCLFCLGLVGCFHYD